MPLTVVLVVSKNTSGFGGKGVLGSTAYVEVNLVTALVPSDTACFASSPGRIRRTAVCRSSSRSVLVTLPFRNLSTPSNAAS